MRSLSFLSLCLCFLLVISVLSKGIPRRFKRTPQSKLDAIVEQLIKGVNANKYTQEELPDDPRNPYNNVQEQNRKDTRDQIVPVDDPVEERTSYVPPAPPELGVCGIEYDCVNFWLCDKNGDIVTYGDNLFDLRSSRTSNGSEEYLGGFSTYPANTECPLDNGKSGVCCRKSRIEQCPNAEICTPGWRCPHLPEGYRYKDLKEHPRGCLHEEPYAVCCSPTELYSPVPQTCGVRNDDGIKPRTAEEAFFDLDKRVLQYSFNESEAKFGEFPWQALLFTKKPTAFEFLCGGVLISTRHLLTAAHYVNKKDKTTSKISTSNRLDPFHLKVRLGEWAVNSKQEPLVHQDYYADSIHVHPQYRPGPEYNDIAIVTLDKPVYITNNVHMACLPENEYENFDGYRCITTGWGRSSFDGGEYPTVMKKVDLPMYTFNDCQDALRRTRLGYRFRLHKNFVCAGGEEGKDACTGDGGGPLVCEKDGSSVVAGIVSWGIGCGTKGVPGVYASVASAMPWIQQIIAQEEGLTYPRKLDSDSYTVTPVSASLQGSDHHDTRNQPGGTTSTSQSDQDFINAILQGNPDLQELNPVELGQILGQEISSDDFGDKKPATNQDIAELEALLAEVPQESEDLNSIPGFSQGTSAALKEILDSTTAFEAEGVEAAQATGNQKQDLTQILTQGDDVAKITSEDLSAFLGTLQPGVDKVFPKQTIDSETLGQLLGEG
ncbi:unnamed protein product [Cyprideis torosa]|uniref:Uncharacterized protein n=1 Tax=Cyprideis torosa TaxID=163714 RepID=A0A7R8W518_9CRUS|nr:unnamed protein product [Cyprideis torosa]CAG0884761.1 unnamed protein product [Cyprideis torosa]